MTTPLLRRIVVISVASVLAAGTLGCGILSKAKGIADTAKVLSQFSDRLGKASTLTYTGTYKVTDDSGQTTTVTIAQKPPNAAFIGATSRFIYTTDFLYVCDTENSKLTCTKSANQSGGTVGTQDDAYIATAGGAGFVTPEMAIGLIAAAALVPGASVTTSDKTIAGQSSLCATATGLDAAASPGDTSAPKDFNVCVTDAGVLSSFGGTSTDGKKTSMELTNYSTSVDDSLFAPPADAVVNNG